MEIFQTHTGTFGLAAVGEVEKKCGWFCRQMKSKWLKQVASVMKAVPGLNLVGAIIEVAITTYTAVQDRLTINAQTGSVKIDNWMENIFMPWIEAYSQSTISPLLTGTYSAQQFATKANEVRTLFAAILAHYNLFDENGYTEDETTARFEIIGEVFGPILQELASKETGYKLTKNIVQLTVPAGGYPPFFSTSVSPRFQATLNVVPGAVTTTPTNTTTTTQPKTPIKTTQPKAEIKPELLNDVPIKLQPTVPVKTPTTTTTPVTATPEAETKSRPWLYIGGAALLLYFATRGKKKK